MLEETVKAFYAKSLSEKFSIADMGCSSGPNALEAMSVIINTIFTQCKEKGQTSPEHLVFLNDLPGNDFNNVFKSLPQFYEKLKKQTDLEMETCFISGMPGTFYGRLFPSETLDFVHASCSVHWLSQPTPPAPVEPAPVVDSVLVPASPPTTTLHRSTRLVGSLVYLTCRKKQTVVARCSTKSEYRALVDATSELFWLRWLLTDMGVTHSSATILHFDNRSAIQISHNDIFHERTKHIEIDCHLVLEGIENNKGNIYISKTSPKNVFEAYLDQFQKDFSLFLCCRAKELKSKGQMILTLLGRSTSDPACNDCIQFWYLLAQSLLEISREGLIEEANVDSFNMPYYTPFSGEVVDIIGKEGSFEINNLNNIRLNWDPNDNDENQNYAFNKNTSGKNVACHVRAASESVLVSHFGEAIIDELFLRYSRNVGEHLSQEKTKYNFVVISMTKKS
ncbi:salicylate carboxymethyltransferase [Manihot esculenta]|uniref:salicylate carboxymethyltransferase n=1 Tax=Manihot esculenta TaxID=3983 RepID=UPI001CC6B333|nr:salicylate carboxymethyltransferase [Manihot esculenta]